MWKRTWLHEIKVNMKLTESENHTVDIQWLKKYSRSGPRYTSYPTAPVFHTGFTEKDYRLLLSDPARKNVPLSFYFHIPYCQSVCYFCACSVSYTRDRTAVDPYTEYLIKEMDLLAESIDPARKVEQLHWGGGSPTFLTPDRMIYLMKAVKDRFSFTDDAEISIELDPRETTPEHIRILREIGFNRASLGIQDVDPAVQKAVNRVQPLESVIKPVYDSLKKEGFTGINLDLIYGLPLQTPHSFQKTIDAVIEMRPARISLFNFAWLPHLKSHQKRIKEEELPVTETRLEIFALAVKEFMDAGYRYIGMDHFALPDDELSVSQENGRLHRNFQGYTTRGGTDLLGVGVTSIGEVNDGYIQNFKDLKAYQISLDEGKLPVHRGIIRSHEDRLRHRVIMQLICHFHLEYSEIEKEFGIRFTEHFARELEELREFEEDSLITTDQKGITVHFQGRFVIRNICMVFDGHLRELEAKGQEFSRTV